MLAVAQANLVQLRVEAERRGGAEAVIGGARISSPGAIVGHREALLDRRLIRASTDTGLALRLREAWGRYCALCWVLELSQTAGAAAPRSHNPEAPLHCLPRLFVKVDEVHALLWRLRFEQQKRHDADFRASPDYAGLRELADRIPAKAHESPVAEATDDQLLSTACEHAGMLAALRWVCDRAAGWNDESLFAVNDHPFPE
jgi:hypothetical protein